MEQVRRTWTRFRALPAGMQVLGWVALWPLLAAVFLWQWDRGGWFAKVAAVLSILLLPGWLQVPFADIPTSDVALEEPERGGATPSPSPSPTALRSEPFRRSTPFPSPTATATREPEGVPRGAQAAVVERIVDGDTIWVRVDEPGGPLPAGASHQIRLLILDTPETRHPSRPVECGGPEATAFAQRMLPVGSGVLLVGDRQDTDRYGRFLRYVWTRDGVFFNEEAIRQGMGRVTVYPPNDRYAERLRAAEVEAKQADRGIWGPPCDEDGAPPPPPPAARDVRCDPSYPDVCIPPPPPDLDCGDIPHRRFRVVGPDPHRFDRNQDGVACESR